MNGSELCLHFKGWLISCIVRVLLQGVNLTWKNLRCNWFWDAFVLWSHTCCNINGDFVVFFICYFEVEVKIYKFSHVFFSVHWYWETEHMVHLILLHSQFTCYIWLFGCLFLWPGEGGLLIFYLWSKIYDSRFVQIMRYIVKLMAILGVGHGPQSIIVVSQSICTAILVSFEFNITLYHSVYFTEFGMHLKIVFLWVMDALPTLYLMLLKKSMFFLIWLLE